MLPILAVGIVGGIGATIGAKFANDVLIPKMGEIIEEVKEAYHACKCDDCGCVNCECVSDSDEDTPDEGARD